MKNNVEKLMPKEMETDKIKRTYFTAGLTSGYLVRAKEILPRLGDKAPWNSKHYFFDLFNLIFMKLDLNSIEITIANKSNKKL